MHPCLHFCTFVGVSLQDKFLEGEFLSQRVCALEMLRDFAELCFSNATPIYTPKKGTSMQFLYSFMRACTQSINQLINHSVNKIFIELSFTCQVVCGYHLEGNRGDPCSNGGDSVMGR